MEKVFQNIVEAEKTLYSADHLINVVFPIVDDKKILLKFLSEIKIAVLKCINFILQYEYVAKKIILSSDSEINFLIFYKKCAPEYGITSEEIKIIRRIFELEKKHVQSAMEFRRGAGVVILSKDSESDIFTFDDARGFLRTGKSILGKIRDVHSLVTKKG
jgi:hypothetical protein